MLVLAMANVQVVAQDKQPVKPAIPRWAPEEGYWVAESNKHQPKQCTIFFYTNEHTLIYKEKIEGVKLNLNSSRVKMRLKKVLETSLIAWRQQR